MELILSVVATMSVGLMIGTEFATSAVVNPILKKLDEPAEAHATRLFGRKLGTVMPFWYSGNLVLLIGETIVMRHEPGLPLLLAAIVLWVFVIVLTLLILVPINNRIVKMESATFADPLRKQHARWDVLHRWRVLILSVAMVCMLFGTRL
jgi:uncharacterized membrane protein